AAGLLAMEYERVTRFRLIPLHRSSSEALSLLRQDRVDVAGIHLASSESEAGSARAARSALGDGYLLLRFATWDEGLALHPSTSTASISSLVRSKLRWVGREKGTGARECQDEILGNRRQPQCVAKDHRGVAEAIRCGWADIGVCHRLVTAET